MSMTHKTVNLGRTPFLSNMTVAPGIVFQAISVFCERMRSYVLLGQKTKTVTRRSADTDYGMKNL